MYIARYCGTTFVFIYVSESSLLRILRENQSTPARCCSMPAIRQTHAKQISLYWDCRMTVLPLRSAFGWIYVSIYTHRSAFYLDLMAQTVALRYSSASYFAAWFSSQSSRINQRTIVRNVSSINEQNQLVVLERIVMTSQETDCSCRPEVSRLFTENYCERNVDSNGTECLQRCLILIVKSMNLLY